MPFHDHGNILLLIIDLLFGNIPQGLIETTRFLFTKDE